jgi:transmembrane sensor
LDELPCRESYKGRRISMPYQQTIQAILEKYLQGEELTIIEARELDRWLDQSETNRALFNRLHDEAYMKEQLQQMDDINETRVWEKIQQHSTSNAAATVRRLHTRKRAWLVAASVLLLLMTSGYLLSLDRTTVATAVNQQQAPGNIQPGKEGAILTLADGRTVVLDSLGNGIIATQSSTQVVLKDGQLVYKPLTTDDSRLTFNTMTTPRGRQYQLILPDGSKVWLNAASSITYPTAFTGSERKVSITGEAYFEVAKISSPSTGGDRGEARMPFIVDVAGRGSVEVLGTHFNINAYDDEGDIKTTLLEGKVKVFAEKQLPTPDSRLPTVLSPGEQAQMNDHSSLIRVVKNVDVEEVMAWKNGHFHFNDTDLKTMMRQLSRWYDIEVKYAGHVPADRFSGKVSRSFNLMQVLKMLEFSDLDIRIEGRALIVGK